MSVQTEIDRIITAVEDAHIKVSQKGGNTSRPYLVGNLASAIESIPVGKDPVLQQKTVTPTTAKQTVKPDSGYDGLSQVDVNAMPTATQATPSITVSSTGLITAKATQSAGYVASGTKQATKQLTTQAAKTVTPSTSSQTAVASGVYTTGAVTVSPIPNTYVKPTSTKAATTYTPTTSNQTIAAGTYCYGTQTIKGDANLKAENIAEGVSIFGVTGTHSGGGSGGGSVETCTVDIATSAGSLSCVIYLRLVDGKVTTVYLDAGSGDTVGQRIVLNDVICGSFLSVLISSNMYGVEKNTGLVMIRNNTYWKITVGSGETAILRFHNPF